MVNTGESVDKKGKLTFHLKQCPDAAYEHQGGVVLRRLFRSLETLQSTRPPLLSPPSRLSWAVGGRTGICLTH